MPELGVLYVAWLIMCVMVFNSAWVAEDAYITFRVIDNFSRGYGLRWNIYERVQVYTHPLWMLLHIPLYALWHNLFHVTIGLSIVCSMASLLVILATTKKELPVTLVCFFLPLTLSRAFFDYTTSGLENPLSYLLFAVFGYVLLNKRGHPRFWLMCSATVALAMLNRLDTILLYLPALLWLGYKHPAKLRWKQIIIGALPLWCWLGFSLFYYGFLFPNTKYAKLSTGLSTWLYLNEGLHYAKYLVVMDTASALLLLIAPVMVLWAALRYVLRHPRLVRGSRATFTNGVCYSRSPRKAGMTNETQQLYLAIACGICCGIFYVIYVGGDYMAGRFWALPAFASIWLGYMRMPGRMRLDLLFCVACIGVVSYFIPIELQRLRDTCNDCVVDQEQLIDARGIFDANRLVLNLMPLRLRDQGDYKFADDGRKLAQQMPPQVKSMFYIGMTAYYAGPSYPIVDELGLADPLLARLPAATMRGFYIGHFHRDIPHGYFYAIRNGSTERMDPALALYYNKLHLIASGDLWSKQRLIAILKFNTGMYDHWKQDYVKRNTP